MRRIALDTETTGLEADDRIIEVAFVDVDTGQSWTSGLLDPGRRIDPEATAVHGITDQDVQGKPTFADIARDFMEALHGGSWSFPSNLIYAHHAKFDRGALEKELTLLGYRVETNLSGWHWRCTKDMAREQFPHLTSHRLDDICRVLDIDRDARDAGHSAILDATILARVVRALEGPSVQEAIDRVATGRGGAPEAETIRRMARALHLAQGALGATKLRDVKAAQQAVREALA